MKNTPLRAVRKYCLWCMKENPNEVRLCPSNDCFFYYLRSGKREKKISVMKSIRARCRDCGEGSWQAIKACEFPECPLYTRRSGHRQS